MASTELPEVSNSPQDIKTVPIELNKEDVVLNNVSSEESKTTQNFWSFTKNTAYNLYLGIITKII
jgi:hypothetical protein